MLNGSETRRLTDALSPSSFRRTVKLVNFCDDIRPPSTFIGARYRPNAWIEVVGVTSTVPFNRTIHVTASVPAIDEVEPPSVTILKTLPPAKPVNRFPSRSEPFTSAPHELLRA